MEYTQQEVQSGGLVEALNELGKQKWDVFQVVPLWKFEANNGETELTPQRYQILAPAAGHDQMTYRPCETRRASRAGTMRRVPHALRALTPRRN